MVIEFVIAYAKICHKIMTSCQKKESEVSHHKYNDYVGSHFFGNYKNNFFFNNYNLYINTILAPINVTQSISETKKKN